MEDKLMISVPNKYFVQTGSGKQIEIDIHNFSKLERNANENENLRIVVDDRQIIWLPIRNVEYFYEIINNFKTTKPNLSIEEIEKIERDLLGK